MKIRKRLQFFCYLFSLLLILSSCSSGGSGSSDNTTIGSGDSGTKATKPNTVTVQPRAGGKGFTSDSGILPEVPLIGKDGGGKKLLAVYMVGSDLEGVNGFGTDDLNEMLQAEDNLADLEVVVAFGGSSNWKGMRFADLGQIRADFLEDEKFGNAAEYLYEAPGAHMGDVSSLKKFLDQLTPTQILDNEC